jgi:hypothetical protein
MLLALVLPVYACELLPTPAAAGDVQRSAADCSAHSAGQHLASPHVYEVQSRAPRVSCCQRAQLLDSESG